MEKQIEEMAKIIHKADENCPFSFPYRFVESLSKHGRFRTNAAIELYNADYRKREWISVEDRLPERGQTVLCYRGDFRGDMMNTYVYLGSDNWEDDYGYRGTAEHEGITHWMPLPEAPKGGAE